MISQRNINWKSNFVQGLLRKTLLNSIFSWYSKKSKGNHLVNQHYLLASNHKILKYERRKRGNFALIYYFTTLKYETQADYCGLSQVTMIISEKWDTLLVYCFLVFFWMYSAAFLLSKIWNSASVVQDDSERAVLWKKYVEVENQVWNFAERKSHLYN